MHDDFEREVIVGLLHDAQFGDLRPLPLAEPVAVFVEGGEAVFVADEYRRVPKQANQAFVKNERARQGVHKRIPGEPAAAGGRLL